jgi:hypothetical protein
MPRLHLPAQARRRLHQGIDSVLGILLLVGAVVHASVSFAAYPIGSPTLVWSLSGSGLAALLAVLNLLRTARPQDRTLAWVCAGGCVFWALVGIAFGFAIDHLLDPQVVFHVVVGAALADCSVVTATRKDRSTAQEAPSPPGITSEPAVRTVELPVSVPVRSPPPVGRIPSAPDLRLVSGGTKDA